MPPTLTDQMFRRSEIETAVLKAIKLVRKSETIDQMNLDDKWARRRLLETVNFELDIVSRMNNGKEENK